jgi:1-acyl-sn-glycerol-3-phosphate acyltransferase
MDLHAQPHAPPPSPPPFPLSPAQPAFTSPPEPADPSLHWKPIELADDGAVRPWHNRVRCFFVWLAMLVFIVPCMVLVALGASGDWVLTRPIVWWAKVELWILGLKLQIEGRENLPDGPFILMANHQSVLDVFIYGSTFDRPIFYVLKKEFGRIPLLGWFLRQIDQVFLDRKDREKAIASLQRGVEKLREGKMTVIFPEGTRTPPGTLGPFKKGPFHLALQAKVPVVPVACLNSGLLLPTKWSSASRSIPATGARRRSRSTSPRCGERSPRRWPSTENRWASERRHQVEWLSWMR